MTSQLQPKLASEEFQLLFQRLYEEIENLDFLHKIREKAWNRFKELGLPSKKVEAFRYLRLRQLYEQTYEIAPPANTVKDDLVSHIYPECKRSVLVFVNGRYQPLLSNLEALPERLVICSLEEATRTYSAFLNNQLTKTIKEEADPFVLLNTALHRDAAFVYLPPKSVVDAPIQILNIIDTHKDSILIMPRLQVFVGAQSQVDILSTQALLSGKGYLINQVTDFAIEEEAHVRYNQVAFNEDPNAWCFDATRASLKRNSTFKTVNATNGCQTIRHDYRISLTGENSEALLNGLLMLANKNEAHTHILMEHQAPFCRSLQLFKGVLNDNSHSSFEGKILVRQEAQKTEAFQLNNNLLLSDRALAESKPNLEIFADDVKASHGATVGQLDEDQLFYMKTRGFSSLEAKNFLVFSFCKEVIDLIQIPSMLKIVTDHAKNYLSPAVKNG